MRRILLVAGISMALAGCLSDKPQYVFQITPGDAEALAPFETLPHETGLIVEGPFQAPCEQARFRESVREARPNLTITMTATGCTEDSTPQAFRYRISWNGLDRGSYTLRIEHYGAHDTPDGVVYEETVVLP